jgi:hypothetical protein
MEADTISNGRSSVSHKNRRNIFSVAFIAVFAIGFLVVSCSGKVETVRVKNDTGYDVRNLNISNPDNTHWDTNDVLGRDILKNGEIKIVNIPTPLNAKNIYDFRLIDEDGDRYIKYNIRVKSNSTIIFVPADIVRK